MALTDFEAVEMFRNGEEKGLSHFFSKWMPQLRFFACKFLHDTEEVEDAVIVSFQRVWEKRNLMIHPGQLKSYIYSTIKAYCITELNKKRDILVKSSEYHRYVVDEKESSIEHTIIKAELYSLLRQKVDGLPTRCREIFVLHVFGGIQLNHIAKKLGISVSTSKNQYQRGLTILRQRMGISKEDYLSKKEDSEIRIAESFSPVSAFSSGRKHYYRKKHLGFK